ncbi:MAG: tRNA-dihydrouridine synthase, partial [Pseudomonadota bacterium]
KLHLSINGGVETIAAAQTHLATQLQGVMVGRAAYHNPAGLLMTADSQIFGVPDPHTCRLDVARAMVPVLDKHLAKGGRMHQMTRHMLGLFAGQPGARHWRRTLSEIGADPSANTQTYCGIVKDLAGIQHQNPMH